MGQTVFMSLARDRFLLGKSAEAWHTLDAAIRRNPRTLILTFRARAYLLSGRLDSAETDLRRALELSAAADRNADGWLVAVLRATMARQTGELARARAHDTEMAGYARETGNTLGEFEARLGRVQDAVWLLSRPQLGRAELPALRRLAEGLHGVDRPIPELAEAYAEVGDATTGASILREYERGIAPGEWRETEPGRHLAWAQIALAEGRPLVAVREIRAADVGVCVTCVLPLLSLAYDRAGQPDSAIAVGERYLAMIDPSTAEVDGFHRPVLHRRLGELYARRGDVAGAERHLNAFVMMWRNADAQLQPQVEAARHQIMMLRQQAIR
jgi:tetratricopeptide (TPR) repeat protein